MTIQTKEQYILCCKEFVSYRGFIYAILGILVTLLSVTVAASVNFTEVKERAIANTEKIESMEIRMDKKLDQIISLMGGKK